MTNQKQAPIYLRQAEAADAPAEAFFEFEGTPVVLYCYGDEKLELRAVLKDGKVGKTVHGKGGYQTFAVEEPGEDGKQAPYLRGHIVTTKGSQFVVNGYWHEDEIREDAYTVLRIYPRVIRKGFMPRPRRA